MTPFVYKKKHVLKVYSTLLLHCLIYAIAYLISSNRCAHYQRAECREGMHKLCQRRARQGRIHSINMQELVHAFIFTHSGLLAADPTMQESCQRCNSLISLRRPGKPRQNPCQRHAYGTLQCDAESLKKVPRRKRRRCVTWYAVPTLAKVMPTSGCVIISYALRSDVRTLPGDV